MAGARALLLALAAAPAGAQHFQAFRGFASSSSFVRSSSWGMGSDGQVHQSVHEVRTETTGTGQTVQSTKTEVVECADGRCRQMVTVARPGQLAVLSQPVPGRMMRLRAILQALSWPRVRVVRVAEEPPRQFLAPRPQVQQALSPGSKTPGLPRSVTADLLVPLLGLCGASASLASLLLIALMRCSKQASAREPPLRPLGEPLAAGGQAEAPALPPAKAAAARPAPAKAAESPRAGAEQGYLLKVYQRAVDGVEAAAAAGYLKRVYARAAA